MRLPPNACACARPRDLARRLAPGFAQVALLASLAGCFNAPNIVVLDRATALELEAAGKFPRLDQELERAALTARPSAVTREQLDAAGQVRPVIEELETSEAERIDALLVARCLGEALDGSLVETHDSCAVKEVPHMGSLIERANRDRAQIWEWLRTQRPDRSTAEVRRAWRAVHVRGIPCGAQQQKEDGGWEPKKC